MNKTYLLFRAGVYQGSVSAASKVGCEQPTILNWVMPLPGVDYSPRSEEELDALKSRDPAYTVAFLPLVRGHLTKENKRGFVLIGREGYWTVYDWTGPRYFLEDMELYGDQDIAQLEGATGFRHQDLCFLYE